MWCRAVAGGLVGGLLLLTSCGGTEPEVAPGEVATAVATATASATVPSAVASMGTAVASEPTGGAGAGDSSAGCVSNSEPEFTHHYTDAELIDFINPTIVTSSNWLKNRQYHKVVTDAENNAPEVPVYAPMDAIATGVTHYAGLMFPWTGEPFLLAQFDIRFRASCEVFFTFDHVSRLVEPFASLAAPEPSEDTRDAEVPLQIEVEAGQLIGYTSGTQPAHTWDFLVWNTSQRNEFANQERYEGSGELVTLLHAVCPWDYYAPELAVEYTSRLGGWQGRAADAGCNLEVDVPGTLAGGWFMSPYDASDEYRPTDWGLVASLGGDGYLDINGPGVALRVADTDPTFVAPWEVTEEHCFEGYQGERWAYVSLQADETLAAAFGSGSCPAAMPDGAQVFHR